MDEIYYSEVELQDIIKRRVDEIANLPFNTPVDDKLLRYSNVIEMYEELVDVLQKEMDDMQNEIDYLNYYIDTLLDDIGD